MRDVWSALQPDAEVTARQLMTSVFRVVTSLCHGFRRKCERDPARRCSPVNTKTHSVSIRDTEQNTNKIKINTASD